jgi:uncharacterized protein (DUF849 family)
MNNNSAQNVNGGPLATSPFIVMSAPNGARLTHKDHLNLPITPTELADCAESLLKVGVSILHLHVRDDNDKHSLDIDKYKSAMKAITDRVGNQLILQITTEAVGIYQRHQQMALVRALMPEAVSLALKELCPDENSLAEASAFFKEIYQAGVWSQYILYSPEEVLRFDLLRKQGFFGEEKPFALFVLGRYSDTLTGDPKELDAFLECFELGAFPWAVCCFGATESQATQRAHALGGHVRIGFENNRQLPDGSTAQDNAELIKETLSTNTVDPILRPLATANWIRRHLITKR